MVHCYREFPNMFDEVPRIGVMGPWAMRSGRRDGMNDGERGEAQDKLNWSLLEYKLMIARAERWKDCTEYYAGRDPDEVPPPDVLRSWHEANGAEEIIRVRMIDGRACMASKIGMTEDKTLLDLLNECGMCFQPAPGGKIATSELKLDNALAFALDANGAVLSKPELTFGPRVQNHIWAMKNYTGADGQRGACKEPIDCMRYLFTSGLAEARPGEAYNVMVVDPAPERNWFFGWYRIFNGVDPRKQVQEVTCAARSGFNGDQRMRMGGRRR